MNRQNAANRRGVRRSDSVSHNPAVCHDIMEFCARVLAIFARSDYAACLPRYSTAEEPKAVWSCVFVLTTGSPEL